jgi:NAD(P)-dependent dehydrogenase (short-subunit alcohol dehydrogenase family)
MDIENRTVLLLGGSGLVGVAVARALVPHRPRKIVLTALTRAEIDPAVEEFREEADGIEVAGEWGDMFWPESLKGRTRGDVLGDPEARTRMLDDLYGDLTDEVVHRSYFASLLDRHRPDLVVDCVNTATAFAYQNVFASATELRTHAETGECSRDLVERHLATLYLPQLIRHVQIALEAMRRAGTRMYLKIGTAGTGGQGLNIPFTHSEERPSRQLLAKAGVAGAHTLLLYLMARTPGAPAVKEIKPTAAISWKRIGYGEVTKRGRAIERFDATGPVPVGDAFTAGDGTYEATGGTLEGVYLDAGENGLFSLGEFETLTALGLMEYITPEEIADDVIREIRGYPTGHDVVAALDASTSGPTYRAGVLREVALARMEALEREHGVESVAYEMLGPPRLSKLLFEVAILRRLFRDDMDAAAGLDPDETAERARALIEDDRELRVRILSIGLPILLPNGAQLLRGRDVKVGPEPGQSPDDPRLADNGWVDLRASNWTRWRDRLRRVGDELHTGPTASDGSRADREPHDRGRSLRPGRLAAWVFRTEDEGERIKR